MNKTIKRIIHALLWVVLAPIILVLLLFIALYIPPVQKWAVDIAAEKLSEEMGMRVTVDRVLLKFPLDLSLGGVVAIKDDVSVFNGKELPADTVLNCEELLLNVSVLPLFSGELQVDEVSLKNTHVNTLDLIDALMIQGHVGDLHSDNISMLYKEGSATIPNLSLSNSNLILTLADSVPEDTTEEEPAFLRVIDMKHVAMDDVALQLNLSPSQDSMSVTTHFDKAVLSTRLNLENGDYFVNDLTVSDSYIGWDVGEAAKLDFSLDNLTKKEIKGFNPNHINMSNVNLEIDSLSYLSSGDLYVGIKKLSANDRSGLCVDNAKGTYRMDNKALYLDDFYLKTPESDLHLNMQMDMNAWDEKDPGVFTISAQGTVGKSDIMQFTNDFTSQFDKSWPNQSMTLDIDATGNMQNLYINHLTAQMPGAFNVSTSGSFSNLMSADGNMDFDVHIDATGQNLAFVKSFMPVDVRNSFNIPRGVSLNGDMSMRRGVIKANAMLRAGGSAARIITDYDTNSEYYMIDLDAKNFLVNSFVPLPETTKITGHVYAKGKGFDFNSPLCYTNAKLNLAHASYGQYYLTKTQAALSLKNHHLGANIDTSDPRLIGHFDIDGTMTGKNIAANAVIDLPYADIKALGFSADPLTATATHGTLNFSSNYDDLFLVDMNIQGVQITMNEKDSLVTDLFDLYAMSTVDSTAISAKTGDFVLNMYSPNNLFKLIDKYSLVGKTLGQQLKDRDLNLDQIKSMMPEATLYAKIGNDNPISKFIALKGYEYNEISANLQTSKEFGLRGDAHVYAFKTDSMSVDTIFFNLQQDSTYISFNSGITCSEQELFPAFSAYVDGHIEPNKADVRLSFFDENHEKGLDLGFRGVIGEDSVLRMTLFPEKLIIAYREFTVSPESYIHLHKKNRMFADVFMQSTSDSCTISLKANPDDTQLQNINAVINNVDLKQLLTVLPFVPRMTGNLSLSADYIATEDNYSVEGLVSADDFTYEGVPMGNIMTMFRYHPIGDSGHDINAVLFQNEYSVAKVDGTYNVDGNNKLDMSVILEQLPVSLADPFIPDNICAFEGVIDGLINVKGPLDSLIFNGNIYPDDVHVYSDIYSFDLRLGNEPITFSNSLLRFNGINIYGAHDKPLTINGFVDFSDLDNMKMNLSLYGKNFAVFDAPRTHKSALFGTLYGDFFARVNGTLHDLKIRGLVNVLNSTDMTYIMTNTPLTVDYRLDDIVTFVDFSAPPDVAKREPRKYMGIDLQLTLEVEDGAKMNCEFSADGQSYVNVQGGGTIRINYTPEGVFNMLGRYTINEGEMKYTLPVIPLKTFTIKKGSYIEFTGEASNPILNIEATETQKASVGNDDGSSRSVLFNTGLRITNTLNDMGLEFTIDAPEDLSVQNELASMTAEEKNKLAVAMLATGMYLSSNNSSGFTASNALNQFLQTEINSIAGKAVNSALKVDMSLGLEQNRSEDGSTRTDYSFKFSKRFFSDRLNVIIGGKVSTGANNNQPSGAYIDDVSLEWRLDKGGTQYIRLFHDKNYDNLVEGEITENGAGVLLRKKVDKFSDLIIWKKKKKDDSQSK